MAATSTTVTPMMAQFLEIKEEYPNAILFYRMGDFYEMFFDDAVAASAALDIALTKRGKHKGADIPMCGVPFHAAEGYLLALIRKGFRVAVCEQLESPSEAKKRGYKSVVKRGVVRLVTPGTLTEDSLLSPRHHNYLCAFSLVRGKGAFAWADVSTGDFNVVECPQVALGPMLARLSPKELLVTQDQVQALQEMADEFGISLTELGAAGFDSTSAQQRLCKLYNVQSLEAFGKFERTDLSALGAIIDYLEITQKGKLPLLKTPVQETQSGTVQIDAATRRNLELTRNMSGERNGSLLSVLDRSITGAGARLLENRLCSPSTDITLINNRLDAVSFFGQNEKIREICRSALKQAPDIDRALSRLSLDRGGPRDLVALRNSLVQANTLSDQLSALETPTILSDAVENLRSHEEITNLLLASLNDEPPLLARDGGFIQKGYNHDLDEARTLRDEGRKVINGLIAEYIETSGINSLKIKHNNVLGYFIETPASHAAKMLAEPLSNVFIHRQTTANAVRFTTVALSDLETKIINAGSHAQQIETALFEEFSQSVLACSAEISGAAKALAEIDVTSSLADLAIQNDWTKPNLYADKRFSIVGGRHPVVEAALQKSGTSFVSNDCDLSPTSKPLWLLTGPNMAGKSTFLRQNALIALLAQIGSYVPATSADIGVVTQLFSRVGAADDLARGRSTFMVEMVETAAILNQADDGALVILDEIGRGTATYDGLSIAWATLEHLHDINKCRTLFATHYHELTKLTAKLDGLLNATVSVREWNGEVIFLHEVKQGAADRSYGVQVAQLAGLPIAVVERARSILDALEEGDRNTKGKAEMLIDDLPLFSATPSPQTSKTKPSKVEDRLDDIHPDDLTAREALDLVYQLKALSND